MRDDLLDARAAIDWAISDLPILQGRIDKWLADCPYTFRRDFDSQPGKQVIRFCNVKTIPRAINAEVGVVIHSIRSSLDILAVALAERHGASDPKDVYFPIWKDVNAFNDMRDSAHKKIERLSGDDRLLIENLKPYKGGNDLLATLHALDLTRKHRRLLDAYPMPNVIGAFHSSLRQGLEFVSHWQGFKEDAVIATTSARATDTNFYLALEVRFVEAGPISNKPIIAALNEFAGLAYSIIDLFDT